MEAAWQVTILLAVFFLAIILGLQIQISNLSRELDKMRAKVDAA